MFIRFSCSRLPCVCTCRGFCFRWCFFLLLLVCTFSALVEGGKGQRWRELACELLLWVLGGVLFGRKQIR